MNCGRIDERNIPCYQSYIEPQQRGAPVLQWLVSLAMHSIVPTHKQVGNVKSGFKIEISSYLQDGFVCAGHFFGDVPKTPVERNMERRILQVHARHTFTDTVMLQPMVVKAEGWGKSFTNESLKNLTAHRAGTTNTP